MPHRNPQTVFGVMASSAEVYRRLMVALHYQLTNNPADPEAPELTALTAEEKVTADNFFRTSKTYAGKYPLVLFCVLRFVEARDRPNDMVLGMASELENTLGSSNIMEEMTESRGELYFREKKYRDWSKANGYVTFQDMYEKVAGVMTDHSNKIKKKLGCREFWDVYKTYNKPAEVSESSSEDSSEEEDNENEHGQEDFSTPAQDAPTGRTPRKRTGVETRLVTSYFSNSHYDFAAPDRAHVDPTKCTIHWKMEQRDPNNPNNWIPTNDRVWTYSKAFNWADKTEFTLSQKSRADQIYRMKQKKDRGHIFKS